MIDKSKNEIFFKADIQEDVPFNPAVKKLPTAFIYARELGPRAIRTVAHLSWQKLGRPTEANIKELVDFNRSLRKQLHYINGTETLWYLKTPTSGPRHLDRQLPTLILAAMHRLSEIAGTILFNLTRFFQVRKTGS